MRWQFLKKQSFVVNTPAPPGAIPGYLDNDLDNSSPPLQKELSNYYYIDKRLGLKNIDLKDTVPAPSPIHSAFLKGIQPDFLVKDKKEPMIEPEMRMKMIEAKTRIKTAMAIIKQARFDNLCATLDNLHEECKEEGFMQFSETAKQNAKEILQAVYDKFSDYEYYLYPTEDREIAIDCNPQKGRGILILCDSEGGVAYFSTLDGRNSRFRCDNIENFPYNLLWKEFTELNKEKTYSLNEELTGTSLQLWSDTNLPSITQKKVVYHSPTGVIYQYA